LYFAFCIDTDDNELLTLEAIHLFVVVLDVMFQNVSELDIIFRFDEAYQVLHEYIMAGELQETSKRRILRIIEKQNQIEDQELGLVDPLSFSVPGQPQRRQTASIAGFTL